MKKIVLLSLLTACLPFMAMAQSVDDDLYFIPKKKTEKKVEETAKPARVVVQKDRAPETGLSPAVSGVVVKDVKGNVRDVDEYNRRYTSRENTFSVVDDTLYIEEKPYGERGEWVNGFEGTQDDYEYAMRIVRFRNPRYAIPVSSPLYWEVVYTLPSWDWNVYDDGFYAYAFPTYTNRLWWDWRFHSHGWGWGYAGWGSPWYCDHWYGPGFWYGGYWGGGYWAHHAWHHHYGGPHYAWGGGYWGGGHGWNGSSARHPGIHAGRYVGNYGTAARPATAQRRSGTATGRRLGRDTYVGTTQSGRTGISGYRTTNRRPATTGQTTGRVVSGTEGTQNVRPSRTAVRNRNGQAAGQATGVRGNNVYTRPATGKASSYDRPSSTRSSVNGSSSSSYQRTQGAATRNAYRSNGSGTVNRSSGNNNSGSSSRSSYSRSNNSGSSSRSSYSGSSNSGSSSRSSGSGSSSGGGGGRRR